MKSGTVIAVVSLLVVLLMCCLVAAGYGLFDYIPRQALDTFGPSAPDLGPTQRILLSTRLIMDADSLTTPYNPNLTKVPFEIRLGDATAAIINRLQREGLIPSARSLRDYLVFKGMDTTLQAGVYNIGGDMSPIQIAQTLQDAAPAEASFIILPGWRLEEIAESLPTTGLSITPEEFLVAASNPDANSPISEYLPPGATTEGFMLPGTYNPPREATADELVTYLTNSFIGGLDESLLSGFQRQGLSVYQAVILASIVQREAVVNSEMPLIASVFANRVAAGMKLESDPTVQYALGFNLLLNTWWTNPLTLDDLQFDSPYNTYLYLGLPPGPISNPSNDALRAVANPAVTPYYFFRAKCDDSGEHLFAETFLEHVGNECP